MSTLNCVILFRFHDYPLVCKNRIRLLKMLNPGVPIYGLYGGTEDNYQRMEKYLRNDFVNIYKVTPKYKGWLWLNGDLAMREWFLSCGKQLNFDRLYLVEWDALVLEPLSDAYKGVPAGSLGLTGLTDIAKWEEKGWYWTKYQPWRGFWKGLISRVQKKNGYQGNEQVCIFPLPVFPRTFLEDYSAIHLETIKYHKDVDPRSWDTNYLPDFEEAFVLGHDEIRVPLYAEILGYEMKDTGFFPKSESERNLVFNANGKNVDLETIQQEIVSKGGRRTFHPFRKILPLQLLEKHMDSL